MWFGSIRSWQIVREKVEIVTDFIFLGSKITVDGYCRNTFKRCLLLGRKADKPRQPIKKQRHHFADKGPYSQSYGFSCSHVWMWELDHKEGWVLKNWCFWTVVLEKTLESPLDCKEIQRVHSNGDQYWIFIERTDAEAKDPILWPPDVKNWIIGKDPDKGMTEDEMVGWHHWLKGHEFEQALGVGDGRESWHAAVHRIAKSWTRLSNWMNWWFVMVFLPRSKYLLILWLQSPSAVIFEPKKIKSVSTSTFSPSICH